MDKKVIIGIIAAVILVGGISWFFIDNTSGSASDIVVDVKRGSFEITVNTSGELDPVNSVSIRGPRGLRESGIREFKIDRLVPEGTVVKAGDFIAELDKSELFNKYKEASDQLIKEQAQFDQIKLDTALDLRQARDQILNLDFTVEEKKIVLEQSAFEPPATIKQAEIELEKANRDLKQARENYRIKQDQAKARMTEASINLNKRLADVRFMEELLASFTIMAPQGGMLIYTKSWDGKKVREGSTISAWNPEVATLPDLSTMLSKTYVNEVDIMKVRKGQKVYIGLDAFPDKRLTGVVNQVANVGEQKSNTDAKVFEVMILVQESDTSLRPAMTTSNLIVSELVDDALFVPLEALHNQGDSLIYVYKQQGLTANKQEVRVGKTNENEVIVLMGLEEADRVYLSVPTGMQEKPIARLPMLPAEEVATAP